MVLEPSRPRASLLDARREAQNTRLIPGVLVFRIESGLFYFNVQNVKAEILSQVGAHFGLKLVISDCFSSAEMQPAMNQKQTQLSP